MKDRNSYIIGVLAFFEIWEGCLTLEEIQGFFGDETISPEFLKEKFSSCVHDGVTYYSTSDKVGDFARQRKEREAISTALLQKAKRFACILRHFPFLRGFAVGNTPGMKLSSTESDIDLFLITEPGRIWTARFFSTLLFYLLGLRAEKGNTKGKFCLSFFVDTYQTDFSTIKHPEDVYLAFWIVTLKPFWGKEFFQKFKEQNAVWIQEEIGTKAGVSGEYYLQKDDERRSLFQKIWELLTPRFVESLCKKILLTKSQKFTDPASPYYNPDMILSDTMQKLHNPDMRREIQERWERRGGLA